MHACSKVCMHVLLCAHTPVWCNTCLTCHPVTNSQRSCCSHASTLFDLSSHHRQQFFTTPTIFCVKCLRKWASRGLANSPNQASLHWPFSHAPAHTAFSMYDVLLGEFKHRRGQQALAAMDTDHHAHVDRPAAAIDTFIGISKIVRLGVLEE